MKKYWPKYISRRWARALLTLFFLTTNASFASAQVSVTVKSPDPYTGNQSWFVYEKNAGEIIQDVATIKNFGNESVTIKIAAVDATSNNSGSFILKFNGEEQKNIGTWTELEKKEFTLQPGERVNIPFTIKIPINASPGQYVGGIIAENGGGKNGATLRECNEEICNTSVAVKTRIGARIYLTIPGAIKEDIQWTSFQHKVNISGKDHFVFRIENRGNISHEPKVKMEILDSAGNIYDQFEKNLGESSPNSVIEPIIAWDKPSLLIGTFTARATMSFPKRFQAQEGLHGAAQEVIQSLSFWAVPWVAIMVIFLLIIGSFGTYGYAYIRRIKIIKSSGKYEVQDGDDLISIGEKNHIPWKKIVQINKLKAPYIVKKGDHLYVPKTKNRSKNEKTT